MSELNNLLRRLIQADVEFVVVGGEEKLSSPTRACCEVMARNYLLPGNCAVLYARQEVAKRGDKTSDLEFAATYDSANKAWAVLAVTKRMEVSVKDDGKIIEYKPTR